MARELFMGPGAGDPYTAATTWGAWGDRLNPYSVAVSPYDIASGRYYPEQWIETPRGWRQVQDTSYVDPAHPNPSGTIEYWLPRGGSQRGGGGGAGGVNPGRGRLTWGQNMYRDLSDPSGPFGMGTRFFEEPSTEFYAAPHDTAPTPTPVPSGQTIVGDTGTGGYGAGVYTGTIGGPGDPYNAGRNFGGGSLWDYLNPFGGTSHGGAGTGDPTQRGVGMAVGTLSNVFLPGLGFVTGPIARYVTHLLQQGASPQQVQQAVAQRQGTTPPTGSVNLPSGNLPSASNPWGGQARGNEWWSGDFGRNYADQPWNPETQSGGGVGNYNLAGPGGGMGQFGTGFGSGTVGNLATAIGFGGNLGGGGPVSLGAFTRGMHGGGSMGKYSNAAAFNPAALTAYYSQMGIGAPGWGASAPGTGAVTPVGPLAGDSRNLFRSAHIPMRQGFAKGGFVPDNQGLNLFKRMQHGNSKNSK